MKHFATSTLAAALLSVTSSTAQADPAAFVGISYHFGGKVGITAKVLSNNTENKVVAGLGATYWFGAQNPFGLDLGAGYTFSNAAALVGYDFLQKQPNLSAGWADIDNPAPVGGDGSIF